MPSATLSFRLLAVGFVVVIGMFAAPAPAQNKSPVRKIDVVQKDDAFVATVEMFAPVPPQTAYEVLTDFDKMAGWVPNVRESRIVARDGNTLTVEQKGTAKFGLLSFPYTSVRKMQLDPPRTIEATQLQGSMKRLASLMKVSPGDNGGTRLDYRLEIVPSSIAATVMSPDFLRGELTDQFTAIVGEMVKRGK
jgi:ribosome-associated toxin RatA of RatAB toxin-antitoxin module